MCIRQVVWRVSGRRAKDEESGNMVNVLVLAGLQDHTVCAGQIVIVVTV